MFVDTTSIYNNLNHFEKYIPPTATSLRFELYDNQALSNNNSSSTLASNSTNNATTNTTTNNNATETYLSNNPIHMAPSRK